MITPEELIKAEYKRVTGEVCHDLSRVTAKMIFAAFEAYADQWRPKTGEQAELVIQELSERFGFRVEVY